MSKKKKNDLPEVSDKEAGKLVKAFGAKKLKDEIQDKKEDASESEGGGKEQLLTEG